MFPIPVTLSVEETQQQYALTVAESTLQYSMGVSTQIVASLFPDYAGPVTITPTNVQQVLPAAETVVHSDITINPIPNNYGLITWNGSTITVS